MYDRSVTTFSWVLAIGAGLLALLLCTVTVRAENSVEDWSWKVDHYERFGIWESVCDHRDDDGARLERCYVTHVDVYAPRPQFGAAFVFLTADVGKGEGFEFRFEPGTQFADNGFRIEREGDTVWTHAEAGCLKCLLNGDAATELIEQMTDDSELVLAFADRHGREWVRRWSAEGFADAVADWKKARAARELP